MASQQLRRLAADARLEGCSEHLRQLADALDNGGSELDAWAEVDVFEVFAPDRCVRAATPKSRLGRLVVAAPPVMVFVPILVTWTTLAVATNAYRSALATTPELANRSFLELWQTGFAGHLPSALTFDRAAIYTLVAVSMVLLTAAWSLRLDRRHTAREDADFEQAARVLHSAIVSSALRLSAHKHSSPARFTDELTASAGQLQDLYREARKAQQAAQRALTISGKGAEDMRTSLEAASGLVREQVAEASRGMHESLSSFGDRLVSGVDALQSSVQASTSTMHRDTEAMRQAFDAGLQHLEAAAHSLDAQVRNLGNRLDDFLSRTEASLSGSSDRLADKIEGLAATELAHLTAYENAVDITGRLIQDIDSFRLEMLELGESLARHGHRETSVGEATTPEPSAASTADPVNASPVSGTSA